MESVERVRVIRRRLQQAFEPSRLEVRDDSEQHTGHAGSLGGAGHYTVVISAGCFAGKSRVEVHREVYQVLSDLIPDEVHALRIVNT